MQTLVGKRVRIQTGVQEGSARYLNGLTGKVVAPHPIAADWMKLELDENPVTPHRDWSVPTRWLVELPDEEKAAHADA